MSGDLRHRIAKALADHEQQGLALDADRYPPERWLCCADAVIAVLDDAPEVTPAAPEPPERPPCDWFAWIGQPFYSCDRCGRPAWEHKGRLAPPESPFGAQQPETGIEWTDEERESCRRKWEPAMLADAERRAAR